ncbi:hypothetical protein CPB97_003555 [Podila verticillata]|uniref:Hydrophobin n=1 Tax=Podila verticillata NRRL 6337 TaxID=1069443 RepID=A0A086TJD9_9FUNG|nr:hypothetical protein CPB97_003555 [Podila verticillata]KFH62066.1 hypothetical protein MVEG_11705 [Podila verticillata NRRL 6337]
MLARTCITYVAIIAVGLISMASAAPADPTPKVLEAIPQTLGGPEFLSVPRHLFPLCCVHGIDECCHTDA